MLLGAGRCYANLLLVCCGLSCGRRPGRHTTAAAATTTHTDDRDKQTHKRALFAHNNVQLPVVIGPRAVWCRVPRAACACRAASEIDFRAQLARPFHFTKNN